MIIKVELYKFTLNKNSASIFDKINDRYASILVVMSRTVPIATVGQL